MFDFKNPDYAAVFRERVEALIRIRANPSALPALKQYYKDNPADFIDDWGCTIDPRNVDIGLPAIIPFKLFPKQREWVLWVVQNWRDRAPGITKKSRDCGLSWLSVATACHICLFYNDVTIGFGSRKEEYVDKIGHPKSLFYKARKFMQLLPPEFRYGFDLGLHAPHMRISFPGSGSVITGEAGDNIGRGDRASIYFVDEAEFLEHPQLVEASLSATTNCRQDISSVNGSSNPIAIREARGNTRIFIFHWRDDPRKDDAWYEKKKAELDPVTVAQEIDMDRAASVEGVLIPSAWVQAAIDAHVKLGIKPTGQRAGALDVADEGKDKNAFASHRGILVDFIEEWSGVGDDIFGTVQRSFEICDQRKISKFRFDSDGIGAGVRGDARVINEGRRERGRSAIEVDPFRGSGAVAYPENQIPQAVGGDADVDDRTNEDFFANAKAQAWWELRVRFQRTFRAVNGHANDYSPDDLISLDSSMENLGKLTTELSQPTYSKSATGKVLVDKKPDGAKSPNLADAVMILFAPSDSANLTDLLKMAIGANSR